MVSLLLMVACTEEKASPPALELSATELDFGEVSIGSEQVESFTLTNSGGGEIALLSVSLVEGEQRVWGLEREGGDSLGAGASVEVNVSFTPEDEEDFQGKIQVRTDLEESPYVYVELSGSGAPSNVDSDGDGKAPADGDCNDGDPSMYPGASELCDGKDNNCDDQIPTTESDADYDNYRPCTDDCDDGDPDVYPGAPEICDDKDSDCDGTEADRDDRDRDGQDVCEGDCNDDEANAYAGNPEVCDGIDNDCTGLADDIDADRDGAYLCNDAPDCDDDDPTAYPLVVDGSATGDEDGTVLKPYHTIGSAMSNLDEICRTLYVLPGSYEVQANVSGSLSVRGTDATEVNLVPVGSERMWTLDPGASLALADLSMSSATTNDDGGAIWGRGASLRLDRVVASGNQSAGDGGVIWLYGGTLLVYESSFSDNVAGDDGGGVALISGALDLRDSSFSGNAAIRGGGLFSQDSSITIVDSNFAENSAVNSGGAVALTGGGVALRRGTLRANTAGISGGGLSIVDLDNAAAFIGNSYFIDNEAGSFGGGMAATGDVLLFSMINNTLVGNEAAGEGAGLYVEGNDAGQVWLWSNLVGWSHGASGLYSSGGAEVAWCTAYSTSSGVDFAGEADENAMENDVADPAFRSWTDDDTDNDVLTLDASSPARNSGPSDSSYNDRDGSRNDRGATGGPYGN